MVEEVEVITLIRDDRVQGHVHQDDIVLDLDHFRRDRDHHQDVEELVVAIEEIVLAGVVDDVEEA